MKQFYLKWLVFISFVVCLRAEKLKTNMESFQKESVVDDVLDANPPHLLNVHWTESDVSAHGGNVLTPTQMKHEPDMHYPVDHHAFYTIIMADPDAPSRHNPAKREWLHWLVVNVPGNKIKMGEIRAAYVGAGPPQGSGLHRYVFMVFKQHEKLVVDFPHIKATSANGREKFRTREFAKKYNLELVAANFVQAEWDDYVPQLYKQLGF